MRLIHMRWLFSPVLALALGSPVMAADLSLVPRKKTVVHLRIHHRAVVRLVRDYDGTPIALRRLPDGTEDAFFVQRASPTRYLNGQPVTVYR